MTMNSPTQSISWKDNLLHEIYSKQVDKGRAPDIQRDVGNSKVK